MNEVAHISIYIARPPQTVYGFASNPANLPKWAEGLSRADVRQDGDVWIVETPLGMARVRFASDNIFGVMDHDVEFDSGLIAHNPMRVVPNGEGSELVFTLIRLPRMTDEQFANDKAAVARDLKTLKALLERK